jgi:hypothetical protein
MQLAAVTVLHLNAHLTEATITPDLKLDLFEKTVLSTAIFLIYVFSLLHYNILLVFNVQFI